MSQPKKASTALLHEPAMNPGNRDATSAMTKGPAAASVQELRRTIIAREAQLDVALHDLVTIAESRASLGYYTGRYPLPFLVGALLAGAWLARRR